MDRAKDAQREYFAQQLHSDVSHDFEADTKEEAIDLLVRVHEEAYEEGYQDGLEAPPPEPSHHYE